MLLCLEILEVPPDSPGRIVDFLLSQRSDDGGFREIRAQKRSGANPTAAAVAALRMLDALSEDDRLDVIEFMAEMQTEEGGLRANTRIPIADLLSSFTAVLTLIDLGGVEQINQRAVVRYARALSFEEGGFRGAAWDDTRDVEYTFYGLGCLAVLGRLKIEN